MLKPSLQLRLSQQLTMTPQLQQAIRLLQLPVMELQTQIQTALDENLMLEVEEPEASAEDGQSADSDTAPDSDERVFLNRRDKPITRNGINDILVRARRRRPRASPRSPTSASRRTPSGMQPRSTCLTPASTST